MHKSQNTNLKVHESDTSFHHSVPQNQMRVEFKYGLGVDIPKNLSGVHKSPNTGCFFNWYPPKKLKYGKPRLGESTLT